MGRFGGRPSRRPPSRGAPPKVRRPGGKAATAPGEVEFILPNAKSRLPGSARKLYEGLRLTDSRAGLTARRAARGGAQRGVQNDGIGGCPQSTESAAEAAPARPPAAVRLCPGFVASGVSARRRLQGARGHRSALTVYAPPRPRLAPSATAPSTQAFDFNFGVLSVEFHQLRQSPAHPDLRSFGFYSTPPQNRRHGSDDFC